MSGNAVDRYNYIAFGGKGSFIYCQVNITSSRMKQIEPIGELKLLAENRTLIRTIRSYNEAGRQTFVQQLPVFCDDEDC